MPASPPSLAAEPFAALRRRFPGASVEPGDVDGSWIEVALGVARCRRSTCAGSRRSMPRVYEVVRGVPAGETVTYGEVAVMAGSPGAARAVGGAMSRCPLFPAVPCHRVVRASDGWSGWGPDPGLKRRLLAAERAARRSQLAEQSRFPLGGHCGARLAANGQIRVWCSGVGIRTVRVAWAAQCSWVGIGRRGCEGHRIREPALRIPWHGRNGQELPDSPRQVWRGNRDLRGYTPARRQDRPLIGRYARPVGTRDGCRPATSWACRPPRPPRRSASRRRPSERG